MFSQLIMNQLDNHGINSTTEVVREDDSLEDSTMIVEKNIYGMVRDSI